MKNWVLLKLHSGEEGSHDEGCTRGKDGKDGGGWLIFIELKMSLILRSIWCTTKKEIAANYSIMVYLLEVLLKELIKIYLNF